MKPGIYSMSAGMRRPTPPAALYAWHSKALKVLKPVIDDTPHCGWFKRKLVKGGVFVPARIWMHQEVCPETGDLLTDEVLLCEVNGKPADPDDAWSWLCSSPITEQEFRYLTARISFAVAHEPTDAFANFMKPIDLNSTPIHF
jgi:hypothetical protein